MPDWSARDELMLIQGIMKCGLGNWKEISEQYVKSKNEVECEEHFFAFFNKSKEDVLPNEEDFIITHRLAPGGGSPLKGGLLSQSSQALSGQFDDSK
jgi:hypothetical protein